MTRTLLLSICLAIAICGPRVFGQETQATTWKGTLNANGTMLRLEVDVKKDGDSYSGTLRSLDQNNMILATSDMTLDSKSLGFSISQIGAKFKGKLSKKGTVAKGTFTQGPAKLPLTLTRVEVDSEASSDHVPSGKKSKEKLKEAWIGELNMGIMKPVMQFRIVDKPTGETTAYFDSITEGRTGFDATCSNDGDEIKFDVAKIKLKYRGTLNDQGDIAEGTWSQGGREIPLTLKKQAVEYSSANVWENRPQRPVAPFPYDAEEVKFENERDNLTLAGTLTIPRKPGTHPVVVLISGSGPQDRDESLMEHKPFLVLADYLTRRGIAVLRYDDRGTNESTGKFSSATTEDFARDASAAMDFLKKHDRINPEEIGLAGHSEGGLIAPMVVGFRDDVAFVCLLAATGVDGITINSSQTEAMLRAEGIDESEIQIALKINQAVINASLKSAPGADMANEVEDVINSVVQSIPESERDEAEKNIRQGIQSSKGKLESDWMRFFLAYDPRPALSRIACPVLAIIGSKDLQVLPDLNMPEIKKALIEGGNKDFEMVELKGLNHLFQKCETGAMSEYIKIPETLNPLALKKIGDWIVSHTTPIE